MRQLSIVERRHAKLIASAEETLLARIPDREREIARQMLYAGFPPEVVSVEDQFDVGRMARDCAPAALQLVQRAARPSRRASATIQTWPSRAVRLMLALGVSGRPQQRVTEAYMLHTSAGDRPARETPSQPWPDGAIPEPRRCLIGR